MPDALALCAACLGAVIPTAIFVIINYTMDRYEREPLWLVSMVFLWGAVPAIIVSIIFSLLLEVPLSAAVQDGAVVDLLGASVIAPVVEEFAKALPLLGIYFFFRREFDGLMDGLIYGSLVGFGFAMTENVLYFITAYSESGFGDMVMLIFLRSIVFGLNHALFTSATGVGLGFARYSTNPLTRVIAPIIGLSVAIFLHGAHNFFVSFPEAGLCFISLFSDYLGIFFWLGLVYFALRQERKWIAEELQFEVASGLLPAEHAKAAASYTDRRRDRARVARERGSQQARALDRLHFVASDLAFKKRQLSIHGEERGNSAEVARLRGEITQLLTQI